jgi:hypothetical protein|tara:strand:+ start:3424 stop:3717 length:294 start_codon:yes stop_codon:yes gene_type:complete
MSSVLSKQPIEQLAEMLERLFIALSNLGENPDKDYPYLIKVKNILKSRDLKGFKNIEKHLMMDFRMIDDRQLESSELNKSINDICRHVDANNMFRLG